MDQPQQPEKREPSRIGKLLSNVVIGAGIGAVVSRIAYKKIEWKTRAKLVPTMVMGIIAYSLLDTVFNKKVKEVEPALPPAPPTVPPTLPDRPQGLELAHIPPILDLLVAKGDLTSEQQQKLLADIKQGRTGFSGAFAVADGYITKEKLDTALTEQAFRKVDAAVTDIQGISTYGTLPVPKGRTANWGNRGVNPTLTAPTQADGLAAVANMAENLAILANAHPDPQTLPVIRDGIIAAANLARGIAQGNSAVVPLSKMGETWRENLNNALILAVQANPQPHLAPRDATGKPIDIYDYIAARNTEITAAVQHSLTHPPERSSGHSR